MDQVYYSIHRYDLGKICAENILPNTSVFEVKR